MFNSFEETCTYLEFPREATENLLLQYGKITADPKASDFITKVYEDYKNDCLDNSLYSLQNSFEKICQDIDVHSFQSQMIFYICLVPPLYEKYQKRGIPEEIFRDSMADLRCKLFECYRLYGIWGSFVAVWFARFFYFTLYGIGRLEFAPYECDYDYEENGIIIKKGDPVIDVHIPSRGRLPHEEVLESYKKAYYFFKNFLKVTPKAFVCESWMLFPKHEEIIPCAKNLMDFYRDYTIVEEGLYPGGDDLWRIFYCFVKDNYDIIPKKTYLQRQYADFLEKGGLSGWGKGICPIGRVISE